MRNFAIAQIITENSTRKFNNLILILSEAVPRREREKKKPNLVMRPRAAERRAPAEKVARRRRRGRGSGGGEPKRPATVAMGGDGGGDGRRECLGVAAVCLCGAKRVASLARPHERMMG